MKKIIALIIAGVIAIATVALLIRTSHHEENLD